MAKNKPEAPPLQLSKIYLRESRVMMVESFDPTLPGQQLLGQYRISSAKVRRRETNFDSGSSQVSYEFITALELVQTPPLEGDVSDEIIEKSILTKTTCEFVVQYLATGDVSEKLLSDWATKQVVFQLWPYFREFCQDAALRMGLVAAPLPLLQINLVSDSIPVTLEIDKEN